MSKSDILNKIEQSGVIAVIRLNDVSKLEQIISALSSGGIYALEITLTTPNAVKIIAELARSTGKDFLIGAGTVLRPHEAEAVLAAGAQFVVSPVFNKQVVDLTTQADKVSIPGAFSSTEILQAWDSGADIVKIFPATALGPNYFKDIHGPLPGIRLTPTGGVSLENAADFIRAGAFCLGAGTALLDKKMIADSDWQGLQTRAMQFVEQVRLGRN